MLTWTLIVGFQFLLNDVSLIPFHSRCLLVLYNLLLPCGLHLTLLILVILLHQFDQLFSYFKSH